MSDPFDNQQPNNNSEPQPSGEDGQFTQQIRHQQVSARVTDDVSRGVFSTGALVLQGNHEFVLDFIVAVTRPHQVVSRVILPPSIVPSILRALQQNIENYTNRFGAPPELPKPPQQQKPPSVEEIYDQLKLPDEQLSGVYANTVMITHSPSEFVFDFITSFYPKSSVSARIFLTVPQVPRLYETLSRSFEQFQKKMAERQRQALEQGGLQMPPGTLDSLGQKGNLQPPPIPGEDPNKPKDEDNPDPQNN